MKINQGTTVYHVTLGKGSVAAVQYRKDNPLYMCYFPKSNGHEFISHNQLMTGDYEITLREPQRRKGGGDPLEDLLGGILKGL